MSKNENQLHDHEFEGSTRSAELEDDPHNHRFVGVSIPAIPIPCGHAHKVKGRTDFFDYFHEFKATSCLQIPVGNGKHVHFVKAKASVNDKMVTKNTALGYSLSAVFFKV
ncbi:YmaF family protein [Clostridium sp. FP1]|uniref:YmaF family protein n=1 Tax=Clostridium sp. FP1 TaxID=2724076 RepID=UPI0013E97844|nr:YmaF family protein [Clostridium sp. FP1]MBZ9635467.1 YmaF family protein [Clostridium sp. FP1]